jgi:hypothetical protein
MSIRVSSFTPILTVIFLTIPSLSFSSGSYVSLLSNPVMEFGGTDDVGRRVGMLYTILAVGAVSGPPISGAINAATGNFEAVGYYAGMHLHTIFRLF